MEWYWGWLQLRLESKVGARVNLGSSSPSSAAVNRTFRLHTSLRVWDLILEKTPLWFEMQNQNPTSSHWKFLLDQRNYNTVMLAWDLAHLLENMSCFTGNFTSLPGIRCDRWILFCAICVIYHTRHILTILYVIVYIVPCERGGGWWRPPPQHLEAAAAYHIIVSICQMMAMIRPVLHGGSSGGGGAS